MAMYLIFHHHVCDRIAFIDLYPNFISHSLVFASTRCDVPSLEDDRKSKECEVRYDDLWRSW